MANVTGVDVKTSSTGKEYKGCTLADGRKVNVFSDHALYSEVKTGFNIPDTLIYQKGQYWNLSDPSRSAQRGAATRASNARSADIKEAQDRKEQSIAFFNATNAAINLVAEDIGLNDIEDKKKAIRMWRDWFLAEHDAYKGHKDRYPEADPLTEYNQQTLPNSGPTDW